MPWNFGEIIKYRPLEPDNWSDGPISAKRTVEREHVDLSTKRESDAQQRLTRDAGRLTPKNVSAVFSIACARLTRCTTRWGTGRG
jgi:hypothetical protein